MPEWLREQMAVDADSNGDRLELKDPSELGCRDDIEDNVVASLTEALRLLSAG